MKRNVRQRIRRLLGLLLLLGIVLAAFAPIPATYAASDPQASDIVIEKSANLQGPRFFVGNSVQIDGQIDGELFVIANKVTINGTITGNAFIAATQVVVNGKIGDLAGIVASSAQIGGGIGGSAGGFIQTLNVTQTGSIGRDLMLYGQNVTIAGQVHRAVLGKGQSLAVSGAVGEIHNASFAQISFAPSSHVAGDVDYTSSSAAQVLSGALIGGKLTQHLPAIAQSTDGGSNLAASTFLFIGSVLVEYLIWLLLYRKMPVFLSAVSYRIIRSFGASLGIGVAALLLTPIVILIALITVVGIPLGLLLLILYIAAILLSPVLIHSTLGLLLRYFPQLSRANNYQLVAIAIVGILLIENIPVIGFVLQVLTLLAGVGSMTIVLFKGRSTKIK
ncbi:MAG: hypothetical protein JWN30_1475 [Bacilli bacterium]|nr:hypothetical protein [Bacilli bacterium]